MANASAKRIANQNESAVKTLKFGMFVPTLLSILLRLLFRRNSFPPSKGALVIYTITFLPSFFLSNYLQKIGTPRRDPTTGTLISFGEDLNQSGVTEWCFDILYVTWTCQIGSGAFGEWFWWLYMVIPLYALYKVWTSALGPMLGLPSWFSSAPKEQQNGTAPQTTSKRQEKLRKRSERGDRRVVQRPQ